MKSDSLQDLLFVTSALSDANRVRVLLALGRHDEVCACQITELLGVSPSTASKHLSILRHAGLIEARKEGRWIHYRLAKEEAPAAAREALRWVSEALAKDSSIKSDAVRMKQILKEDPEILCRRQCGRGEACC